MILSFGWTAHLLPPSGCKRETRRKALSIKAWAREWDKDPDKVHQAWNKVPFAGGKQIGWFRLTHRPYLQLLCSMELEAVAREGHPEMTSTEAFIFEYFWKPKKSWSELRKQDEWDELYYNTPFCVIGFEFFPDTISKVTMDTPTNREQLTLF